MTAIIRPDLHCPGCTCHHSPGLHRPKQDGDGQDRAGCRVGWQGAGRQVPGAIGDVRHWPAGCSCTATGEEATP